MLVLGGASGAPTSPGTSPASPTLEPTPLSGQQTGGHSGYSHHHHQHHHHHHGHASGQGNTRGGNQSQAQDQDRRNKGNNSSSSNNNNNRSVANRKRTGSTKKATSVPPLGPAHFPPLPKSASKAGGYSAGTSLSSLSLSLSRSLAIPTNHTLCYMTW
jgi:hypothetical protein